MPDFRAAERGRSGKDEYPFPVDPIFVHELALELHMPVGELCRRMSAHELLVEWPAFFASRARRLKDESR